MICAGGGAIPDFLPDWLQPWLAASQGTAICGIEWLMAVQGLLVLPVLLLLVKRLDRSPRGPTSDAAAQAGSGLDAGR